MLLRTSLGVLAYVAVMMLCLWQPGSPDPWSRLFPFAIFAILASVILALQQLWFAHALRKDPDVRAEAYGVTYDPGMAKGLAILAAAELLVLLDYGHWHLTPALERPSLQWAGVGLYGASMLWLRAVDDSLASYFRSERRQTRVLTSGVYRYLRHPRYAGLLATRLAFALTFASVIGWMTLAGWIWVVRRRIHLEERHMLAAFDAQYGAYARRTWRLFPGVY